MIVTQKDLDRGIITHVCRDTLTIWDMLTTYHQTVMSDDFHRFPNSLWDLCEASLEVSALQMEGLWPNVHEHAANHAADRRVAWVAGSQMARTLIDEYWRSYSWQSQWQTFPNAEEALVWLAPAK